MASGLLALLDDISTILDDVAVLSKAAAQKTSGIVGDDLAVNAQGLVGIDPSREIPIILKVARGSLINKAWLVPLALVLPNAVITPLLMAGGAFLCFEAAEKILHKHDAADDAHHRDMLTAIQGGPDVLARVEQEKISQAIKTDAILSAEIIAVSLGTVATAPFLTKAVVLTTIGIGMTVLVYGLVAAIIKLDDLGLHLTKTDTQKPLASARHAIGRGLLTAAPKIMKSLGVIGIVAMFLVGGQIVLHGAGLHHLPGGLPGLLVEASAGAAIGFCCVFVVKKLEPVWSRLVKLMLKK